MILLRDSWLQQQQIQDEKRVVLRELEMKPTIHAKASDLVDCVRSLQKQDFQPIARDDLLGFANDFFQAQWDLQHREAACHIEIVYYHTRREKLESIRDDLFSPCEHKEDGDTCFSESIYCSSEPFIFSNERNGGTIIMLARMKTIEPSNTNAVETTIDPFDDEFAPLKGFSVIQRSKDCMPLFQFPSKLLKNPDGQFEQQLLEFQDRVHHELVKRFFDVNAMPRKKFVKKQVHHQLVEQFFDTNANKEVRKLPPILRKDASRRKLIKSHTHKVYKELGLSNHRDKVVVKPKTGNSQPLWSDLETPGMIEARCSLLIQDNDVLRPQSKRLAKQKVCVYQDRGYIPGVKSRYGTGNDDDDDDDDFVVDFEGCTILQLEPSRDMERQTMPTTLTVGGRCVFTAENFRDFRVMMRTKEQSLLMKLLPNGDFDWPDVKALRLCPLCGKTAELPREGDHRNHEYWLVFYPMLQVARKGSQTVLGSRMICRLTCLSCMHKLLGKSTCEVKPPLLNGRRSKTCFRLPTKEVLGEAGSVSFLEGCPPMPEINPDPDHVLDAWTLYNSWEHSGAWEALQNDYRLFLSKSMRS